MNRKGFVLVETMIEMTILCVILIMLYGAYSNILIKVKSKSFYDNTEYIYKTSLIRDYLETKEDITPDGTTVYCSNFKEDTSCEDSSFLTDYEKKLYNLLKVEAIYFTLWDVKLSGDDRVMLEPTTQLYISSLDPKSLGGDTAYRLIVMYDRENEYTDESGDSLGNQTYEYASLRFKSRG